MLVFSFFCLHFASDYIISFSLSLNFEFSKFPVRNKRKKVARYLDCVKLRYVHYNINKQNAVPFWERWHVTIFAFNNNEIVHLAFALCS